jgi:CDP-glycerol glycerophosphotransferase (TagB/SpsB family)
MIAGQVRTDIIPKLLEQNKTLKLPFNYQSKKLVVFASQPQLDPKLRKQAALDVYKSVKQLSDILLVVKLHPAEKNDFEYYRDIANEAGCNNYQIILNVDLYLLLSKTDVLITCFSTVGAEAVYFKKPLITLDHLDEDLLNYHQEGVALKATNDEELKKCLEKTLDPDYKLDQDAYRQYVKKYAYKIDGQVSNRILDFISLTKDEK